MPTKKYRVHFTQLEIDQLNDMTRKITKAFMLNRESVTKLCEVSGLTLTTMLGAGEAIGRMNFAVASYKSRQEAKSRAEDKIYANCKLCKWLDYTNYIYTCKKRKYKCPKQREDHTRLLNYHDKRYLKMAKMCCDRKGKL